MTGQMIYEFLDPWMIWAFRMTENPYIGFAIGIFWICLLATVIGELCMAGIYFLNAKHFAKISKDMVGHHNLSVQALGAKNKEAWKACNSIANDAFGKNFFSHIALFASSLWVVPFGIGWLFYRFGDVEFIVPLIGQVGPSFIFIPAYIFTRWMFGKAKPWLPLFRMIRQKIKENEGEEEMMMFSDIMKKKEPVPDNS
ncbi:conserved membrane protein of unknown function [Pseudodesulfovibrio profundus]|uniref:Uncharacterized protein n=1 Tax=Pseudodesulfovibrio profundus TaxID=57320 RepID=A0A2C8FDU0_9BACT|nr:hypothetical protein [Pseudodesulfovibrio profundus]MBC16886.1 hypothetical protein [Desulfovibrio sp.]SOB60335.1 conserved membrane protein of unknown function [Pseudodesulfovibrio profundus]|tara:strand:- start:13880 stop:14473 length:594 start_codon:yes stop_codon:yes gene_type:complete